MKAQLITKTRGAVGTEYELQSIDEIIVGIARVSSGKVGEHLFSNPERLIRYTLLKQHWSVFEMANLTISVTTSRAMGREILRHGFGKQEFSQRYAPAVACSLPEQRMQGAARQSSTQSVYAAEKGYLETMAYDAVKNSTQCYDELVKNGVSFETARMVLPECTETTMHLNGTIRIWLSFLNQRLHKTAQKEVRDVAQAVRDIFIKECPIISEAMFWFDNAENIHIFERLVLENYGVYEIAKQKAL
jgi:thymidylate synthase (FAD)